MSVASDWDIYLSFFMFTADLKPNDPEYTKTIIKHIRVLTDIGYTGFDLPIPPPASGILDAAGDLESYTNLKRAIDDAGFGHVGFTTNVFAPRTFDSTSPYPQQREEALAYLKSRVDISAALGASIMAGPIVHPYAVFPTDEFNNPFWSDALQDWLAPRYLNAHANFEALAEYAEKRNVKIAIEPVDHWETAGPNLVTDVMRFLEGVENPQVGVCIDSSHVVLGSDTITEFQDAAREAGDAQRLNYVQVSAPDRGAVQDSWIPYDTFLPAVLPYYTGPILIEVFNAVPPFEAGLRLTRRKFWIPGEDTPNPQYPDAYTVATAALDAVRRELS